MNLPWLRLKGKMKGWGVNIPYNPILPDGDSSAYFGTYEGQRFGAWDTACCWDFSACEVAETRLEMLWKLNLIPQETKDWLTANGYIDSSGDFYLSRRWVAILSGVQDGGNSPVDFWDIASVAGLIPNKMLPYDPNEARKWITQKDFNNDYFNPQVITAEMEHMGLEFLKRFNVGAQSLPGGYFSDISTTLQTYLKEGSLQIGHPVPQDGSWNRLSVMYPVGRTLADHATELYKFDPLGTYPFFVYDSYQPNLKQLSKNYFIPVITRVSIVPLSPLSTTQAIVPWQQFWQNVYAWLVGNPMPYPKVPVGSAKGVVPR